MKTAAALVLLLLAACGTTYAVPGAGPAPAVQPLPDRAGPGRSAADFRRVAARVEPVAEAVCREEAPGAPPGYCDYRVALVTDPRMPPNAFQTRGPDGRPVVAVSASLLGEMRSNDEVAFVLSHEAAHHVAAHLPRQQQSQMLGALVLGGLVAATGGSQQAVSDMMDLGAFVGGRAYSQAYELEADWLGAFIAARAGYDPERGAQIFVRPALASAGGPAILSTHPPSPRRAALASQAAAEIRRQRALGLTPRPAYAGRGSF